MFCLVVIEVFWVKLGRNNVMNILLYILVFFFFNFGDRVYMKIFYLGKLFFVILKVFYSKYYCIKFLCIVFLRYENDRKN